MMMMMMMICVKLNEMNIENVHQCRYLAIYVDDMLTWSHHIDIIYSKFLKYIGIFFYKIRNKLPMVILKKYLLCICTSAYFVRH